MDFIKYEELWLPPITARHGGLGDFEYVEKAKDLVARTERYAGLTAKSTVVDIGCGAGRFLIGMLATYGSVNRYTGIDVRKDYIDGCLQYLVEPDRGDIEFAWVNVRNARYNAKLVDSAAAVAATLPVRSGSADFIILFSVFSHMTSEDTGAYLKEIARILAPGGRCFCTAFIEENAPDWQENPPEYIMQWKRPLHCARFSRDHFDSLAAAAGLSVIWFGYCESGIQSSVVLARC